MSQTITLNIPDSVFQPLLRTAQITRQPVEQLLLTALQSSLPSLEELPQEVRENLTELELLDDQSLHRVMLETVPTKQQQLIKQFQSLQENRSLTEAEQSQIAELRARTDLVILRKARAAVLLRLRGKRIPTLAELNQMTSIQSEKQ